MANKIIDKTRWYNRHICISCGELLDEQNEPLIMFEDSCPHCGEPSYYGMLKNRPIKIRRYTLQNGKLFWRKYDVYEGKTDADNQWLRDKGYVLLEDVL